MGELKVNDRSLGDLGWEEITGAIAARASTSRGAERARALPFLPDIRAVEASLSLIEEARQLLVRELPMPVGGVEDIRPLVERTRKGAVLASAELQACASVARAAVQVRRFVSGLAEDVPLLATVSGELTDLSPLAARINGCIEASGALRDDASVALAEQRAKARGLHERLAARIESLIAEPELAHRLQDNYYSLRNDRYVVPVKTNFRSQVPGIVHNASQSGQTIFVELDELIPLGNDLTIAESLAAEEERRVLAELSEAVGDSGGALLENAATLARLDLVQASSRLAEDLAATSPEVGTGGGLLSLLDARHPLLVLQGKKVIANDIALAGDERALVISGPNAGGKTVAMASVGLCLLMIRAGLPIPASQGSQIPLVAGLSCAIGDAQDLSLDLSTFSAHLQGLAQVLRTARAGWFCLVDEIAGGTDPTEGAAIASATLESLVDAGARVVVTTHLDAVKALGITDHRFANARVGLDPGTLRPTFHLELGAAGVSKAIDVADQVGLPQAVIDRAREHMSGGGALTLALARLEDEQRAAAGERRALAQQAEDLAVERRRLEAALADAERARIEAELRVREEMTALLDDTEAAAKHAIAELQARPTMQAAQQAQREVRERIAEQQRQRDTLGARLRRDARPTAPVGVGSAVRIPSLGQRGEVEAIDGSEALVRAGSLRTRVPVAELVALAEQPAAKASGKTSKTTRRGRRVAAAVARDGEAAADAWITDEVTCDLRGTRADDAKRLLDGYLDQRYLSGSSQLLVIHGHGTGVLRQVVREILAESEYVADFRAGGSHEGGDGVTVVILRD